MVPWRFFRSGILERPGRALLTLLSVVIGVATVLAVSISIATTRRAFEEMYQTLAGRAALEVRADGGAGFDIRLVELFDRTPGIQAAVPVLQRQSIMYAKSQRVSMTVLGILPEREVLARDYAFEEGSFPRGNEILLEGGFARNVDVKHGDEVLLLTRRGPRPFRVGGLLAPQGAAAFQGGAIAFMPLDRAQRWFRATNQIDAAYLVLEEGVPEDRVAAELADRLPEGFSITPPATRTELAGETLFNLEQGLNMAAALSLVAAGFIITNSLFMNLSERRRQLATLRTIGATRAQVFGLVALEGLLVGLAGTLLGIVAGIVGATWLTRIMEGAFLTTLPVIEIGVRPFLQVAVLGPGLSLAAVLLPAWRSTRISPLEGMRPMPAGTSDRRGWCVKWIALGLMTLSTAGSVAIYQGAVPAEVTAPVVALGLVGMSLLLPVLLAASVPLLGMALQRLNSANAFLACRQILRQRTRSSLTAGVLFVVVVMSVGMGNSVLNNTQDLRDWVERAIVGDFVVRGTMMFDLTTGESPPLPDGVVEQVRAVPGVKTLEPWTFGTTRSEGQMMMVVARSFPAGAPLSLALHEGDAEDVRHRLLEGEAVISTVVAQRMGKQVGDTITLSTEHGPQTLRIAGTCNDYIMGGTVMYVHSRAAGERLGLQGVHALLIRVDPDRREEIESVLQDVCQKHGLLLHSTAELAETIHQLTTGINASLWAMLAIGFLVAAFGVVNTLTMNVLEQTRELGLMRMVGMTRGQVKGYIVSQAAVMGVVGILPGAAVGQFVAYIINRVSVPVLGHPVEFHARPEVIVGCVALGLVLAVAAAFGPATRAARLLVSEAIQYE